MLSPSLGLLWRWSIQENYGRQTQLVLSPGVPGYFPAGHHAQAEGTDTVADLPISRLKARADPAAPAGSEPQVLLLMLKM